MLNYQKNALLSLLAQFKVKLLDCIKDEKENATTSEQYKYNQTNNALQTIYRNLTGIERAIKKL